PAPQEPAIVTEIKPPLKPVPAISPEDTAARMRVATAMYRQYCLSCHGTDGSGSEMKRSMPAIPDFTNRAWQEGASNAQLLAGILDGKGGLMPAFRGRVSEEQAKDLVAYLRAFGPARPKPKEPPASDFEKRYRELQEEWQELQRQLEELSRPRRQP